MHLFYPRAVLVADCCKEKVILKQLVKELS